MTLYLTFKALHLFSVISWFVAIFYLPRFFVYHAIAQSENDQASIKRFKVMERKLFYMGLLAMGLTIVFGLGMLSMPFGKALMANTRWLPWKLWLVLVLSIYYLYCWNRLLVFADDENTHSHRFYRYLNEIPTLILLAIVFLAILKPF